MANQNPDTTTVRVESSTENGNTASKQTEDENETRQANHGGRRGGGGGSGGNRFAGGNRWQPNNATNDNGFRGRPRQMRGGGNQGGGGFREGGGGYREGGGGYREGGGGFRDGPDERLLERVDQISGPTYDLPPLDTTEKKFSGRARLYIGNLAAEATDEDLDELFKQFGETNELFVNKEKNFGFIRLDYHANAEKAKRELDGMAYKGRNLKIRFAPNGSTIKVKNLTPFVSNELLHTGFSVFGEIERCIVVVDDRGKTTGEGIIQFARKGSAAMAIRKCNENCYFLTSSLCPVIVELHDILDDTDGFPDKSIQKKHPEFVKARGIGPRFASLDSFQHEYGTRWKQLHELYAQKEQALKQELEMEKGKLQAQMEFAHYEHETEMLRNQLRAREADRDRQKREWEMKERHLEESKQRTEEQMRRQEEEMQARIMHQEEELRRRQQENSVFMQTHQLDDMRDEEEDDCEQPEQRAMYSSNMASDMGSPDDMPMDPKAFLSPFRFRGRGGLGGPLAGNMGRGRWVNENRDGPFKRRRY